MPVLSSLTRTHQLIAEIEADGDCLNDIAKSAPRLAYLQRAGRALTQHCESNGQSLREIAKRVRVSESRLKKLSACAENPETYETEIAEVTACGVLVAIGAPEECWQPFTDEEQQRSVVARVIQKIHLQRRRAGESLPNPTSDELVHVLEWVHHFDAAEFLPIVCSVSESSWPHQAIQESAAELLGCSLHSFQSDVAQLCRVVAAEDWRVARWHTEAHLDQLSDIGELLEGESSQPVLQRSAREFGAGVLLVKSVLDWTENMQPRTSADVLEIVSNRTKMEIALVQQLFDSLKIKSERFCDPAVELFSEIRNTSHLMECAREMLAFSSRRAVATNSEDQEGKLDHD